MIINHKREKLLNLIIYFVKNTKYCGKTKLYKLLFFADFECFKETGKSITGLNYYTWPKGPAPVELHNEFKNPAEDFSKTFSIFKFEENDRLNIKPKQNIKFDDRHFTRKELEIIKEIVFIYRDSYAVDMTEISHLKNTPWNRTLLSKGKNKLIDYALAFDNDEKSLSIEQYREIKEANDAIDSILSICVKAK